MTRPTKPLSMALVAALAVVGAAPAARAQDTAREPTDVYIRRLAGLPADSARGAIEILDVGHHVMDTMISIVARRTADGWSVSYACAESPACATGSDHVARTYALSPAAAAEVDRLLATLRAGGEPDDDSRPGVIGGVTRVTIDDRGFRHQYRRTMTWGPTLGRLDTLLTPPA